MSNTQNIPGTNYNGQWNANVSISLTDDFGLAVTAECIGNPNIYAEDTNVYATGCQMTRKDILTGSNVYFNTGTKSNPVWTLGGGSTAGVTSLNGITGAVTLVAGTNITLTPFANSITIASTGGSMVYPLGTGVAVVTSGSSWGTTLGYGAQNTSSYLVQRDADGNSAFNNLITTTTVVSSAGGITAMNHGTARVQRITGTLAQQFNLPDATTLYQGEQFEFDNDSTQTITIYENDGSTLIGSVVSGGYGIVVNRTNVTTNGTWSLYFHSAMTTADGDSGLFKTGTIGSSVLTASKVAFTDTNKNLTSTGIGTSSQFVKADGSLDSSTYLTGNQTITLGGVLSGSGTTSITASYAAGIIYNLNALANASGVLTNDGSGNLSWASSGGTGTVTNVATDSTLTGGPITTTGTLGLNLGNANTWTGQQTFNTSAPIIGTATASTIAGFDASKNLITLATSTYPSLTELSYVKGVTSAIQTQLNAKGAGTVTTVSVATANGVSGSSSGGATPALTITLGAITPTSVNIGTLGYTAANPLITAESSVTSYNQIISQNVNTGTSASTDFIVNNFNSTDTTYYGDFGMNGSGFTGTGALNQANNVYLTATTADLAIGTTTANAIHFVINNGATDAMTISSAGVVSTPNLVEGFTTTATAAGTTTMTIASTYQQYWTGSSTQTVKLPTTSVAAGGQYSITNQSTGSVTVQSSGANTILVLGAGQSAIFTALVATPTTAANWGFYLQDYIGINIAQTASSNAATVNLAYKTNTITNNSAATLTITIPTAGAVDGMMRVVRIFPSTAVAQTLTFVNTENSTVSVPANTGASTTIPIQVGFIYNAITSKYTCIASA